MNEIVLAEITKSETSVIRLMIREYRGAQFFDFRQWYLTSDGDLVGSRKGFTFSADMIPEIIKAVMNLNRYLTH